MIDVDVIFGRHQKIYYYVVVTQARDFWELILPLINC